MISAIVLAAGQSLRMGQQKMLMPWGQTYVIDQVISTLLEAGLNQINIVTGKSKDELKDVLKKYKIDYFFNKDFANGEMLVSVQVGLRGMKKESEAALIVLGDQPQLESRIVRLIIERYMENHHRIIVPSYKMHRGHPWLVDNSYWQEILGLKPLLTMHSFLNMHSEEIDYIVVNTPSVIQDLDTQRDYSHYKP
jgi:molybdenum cofactor cytidylyltransferase